MRTYPRTGSDEYRIAYRQAGILAVINIYRQAGIHTYRQTKHGNTHIQAYMHNTCIHTTMHICIFIYKHTGIHWRRQAARQAYTHTYIHRGMQA